MNTRICPKCGIVWTTSVNLCDQCNEGINNPIKRCESGCVIGCKFCLGGSGT